MAECSAVRVCGVDRETGLVAVMHIRCATGRKDGKPGELQGSLKQSQPGSV